jgi:hypothetical protein
VWGIGALTRAADFDGTEALASFLLLQRTLDQDQAMELAVRSLTRDPRLLAATWWHDREELLTSIVEKVNESDNLEKSWRQAFAQQVQALPRERSLGGYLSLHLDRDPTTAFSLYAFRRPPWPVELSPIPVDTHVAAMIDLPPATSRFPYF